MYPNSVLDRGFSSLIDEARYFRVGLKVGLGRRAVPFPGPTFNPMPRSRVLPLFQFQAGDVFTSRIALNHDPVGESECSS